MSTFCRKQKSFIENNHVYDFRTGMAYLQWHVKAFSVARLKTRV